MKEITLKAYAKINMSLQITGKRKDGYHNIRSHMQDIGLFDVIKMKQCSKFETKRCQFYCLSYGLDVYLNSDNEEIPLNSDNLAIKGINALLKELQKRKFAYLSESAEPLSVYLEKRLPVAAGIAGGSGNAAACMLGLNAIFGYPLSIEELMQTGANVGADVPFSIWMNAHKNREVLAGTKGIENTGISAIVSGIGENVCPIKPVLKNIIMVNPGIGVSTKHAYDAIDSQKIFSEDKNDDFKNSTNGFEDVIAIEYKEVAELREFMKSFLSADFVMMSGSGPTMIAYYDDEKTALRDYDKLDKFLEKNRESKANNNYFLWRAWLTTTGQS